jgi:ribose transport system ATP-binding protein/rhamnose transport system ATP-binding protein
MHEAGPLDDDVVSLEGVTKSFGSIRALREVSFSLRRGEIRAVCGENGAGKSTLVKTLMGISQPDSGTVRINGQTAKIRNPHHAQTLGLGLVAQELSLAPHLSILDNIWLGSLEVPILHRQSSLRCRARAALALLNAADWDLATPVGELTIGQQQIVEIARLLARNAKVLILDEPTATLTDTEIERILSVLKSVRTRGCSIIYVTHRLGEVFELCDAVTVLRNGECVATKPICTMTRDHLIELMLGRPSGELYPALQGGDTTAALVVENLSVPGEVHDLSFTVPRGKIVCLAGQLGSGSQTVPRALAGLLDNATGRATLAGVPIPFGSVPGCVARNMLFLSEDRASEGLFPEISVLDNLIATSLRQHIRCGLLAWSRLRQLAHHLAGRVGLDQARLRSKAVELSGGNQQKLLFGRALREGKGDHILLINEPTRGIDVGARVDIYRLMRQLCDQDYSFVISSSDLEEIVGISDIVITMFRGRAVACYRDKAINSSQILADITHPVSLPQAAR